MLFSGYMEYGEFESQPGSSGASTDDAVSSALRALRVPPQGPTLPWERGLLGVVLGYTDPFGSALDDLPVPRLSLENAAEPASVAVPDAEPAAEVTRRVRANAKVHDAADVIVKRRRLEEMPIDDDPTGPALAEALRMWRGILGVMGNSSELFIQMGEATSERVASRSFSSAFFGKPPSTLNKRAISLMQYIRWARSSKLEPFPLSEAVIFQYMEDLLEEGAPPTRAQSFSEALNFSSGYVGLLGVREVLGSRRVKGSAMANFVRKNEPRKRQPLTKAELVLLEWFMVDGPSDDPDSMGMRDRILAGFVLFCVYGRLRVGDASRINREPTLDVNRETGEGYVEGGMLEHKTSFRSKSRLRLPVAASAIGVSGCKWAEKWLAFREYLGLNASSGFLMPEPGFDGTWSGRRLCTADCTVWLRELLGRLTDLSPGRSMSIGSHSLKATMLSWCGKFGLSAGTRRRLGGHVKPKDRSLVEYSRDELAQPLRELDRVIVSVASGLFDPDASRSGRWTRNPEIEERVNELFPAASTPNLDNKTSDSDSEKTATSASEIRDDPVGEEGDPPSVAADAEEFGLRSRRFQPSTDPLPEFPQHGLVRNRVTGILHADTEMHVRLQCGRPCPPEFHQLTSWPNRPYPLCRNCFRKG